MSFAGPKVVHRLARLHDPVGPFSFQTADTARTVTLALNFDFIFSSLINSIQKQGNSAFGRLKSSQELDKTDDISMTLWYSVLQVVLYPLLGLIMRGIYYGSFLQEVVQIID